MSFFRKLFGHKSKVEKTPTQNDHCSKYMPEVSLPLDECFTINFKTNGGKFLYCENLDEIHHNLNAIIKENNWDTKNAFITDNQLSDKFKTFNFSITKDTHNKDYFFSTCEHLIASDGSILISSRQIAEKKLKELPNSFVIFATTSQFVDNIGEGLKKIKLKNKKKIPTNITTIKHFKTYNKDDNDFLSYGSCSKNLYLLLLEDL